MRESSRSLEKAWSFLMAARLEAAQGRHWRAKDPTHVYVDELRSLGVARTLNARVEPRGKHESLLIVEVVKGRRPRVRGRWSENNAGACLSKQKRKARQVPVLAAHGDAMRAMRVDGTAKL